MTTLRPGALALSTLVTAAALLSAVPAASATPTDTCEATFLDTSSVIEDPLVVEEAIESLRSAGATVRVRIMDSSDAPSMEIFAADEVARCASWQNAEGTAKSNLVALSVDVEGRDMNITAGSRYDDTLGSDDLSGQIIQDEIAPFFRDGEFDQGITAGLTAIEEAIEAGPVSTPEVPRGSLGPEQERIQQDPWISAGAVGRALAWFAAAMGGLALVFGLVKGIFTYRSFRQRRAAARLSAVQAKDQATKTYLELDPKVTYAQIDMESLLTEVSDKEKKNLRPALEHLNQTFRRATAAQQEALEPARQPETPDLSLEEALAQTDTYTSLQALFGEVQAAVDALEDKTQDIRAHQAEIPERIISDRANLEDSRYQVSRLKEQGFFLKEATLAFDDAERKINQAEKAFSERCFTDADSALDAAQSGADTALAAAQALPLRRKELLQDLGTAQTDLSSQERSNVETALLVDQVTSRHLDADAGVVREHQASLTETTRRIVDTLSAIESDLSMQVQEWNRAQEGLQSARALLTSALRTTSALRSDAEHLDRLQATLPQHITDLGAAGIPTVHAFVASVRGDVNFSQHERSLQGAAQVLESAHSKLKVSLLASDELYREAKDLTASVDKQANAEHQAMVRLRKQAAEALKTAKSKISSAQSYLRSHSSDVSSSARTTLSSAEATLSRAQDAGALESQISLANEAASQATSAHSRAQSDVSAEQARRRREEEQRRQAAAAASAASFSSSSSSSSSGSWGGDSGGSSSSGSW